MTVTLHLDSIFMCFVVAVGVGAMFFIKHWKN